MKNGKNAVIAVLAVLVVVLGILLYLTNTDKGKLADTNTGLVAQVESLSGEKKDLESQVESLNGEKEDLEGQVTSLKEEAAQTAEATKAELDKAAEETAAAQAQLDEAVKAREEAEAALQAAQETSEVAQAVGDIDYATVFPSWNPDSEALKELVDFVAASVDESNAGYIAPADRVATFDMDGTIISEKAPIYIDSCLTMYRVLDDPTYSATEGERAAMQEMRDHAYATGENYTPETYTKNDLIASAFAGMTPAQFRAYVSEFADTVDAVGFTGMTYGESFYKPMLEVIDFLRANDYDVWMVSACEREVVRALVGRFGIPFDHVVATDVPYVASGKGDEPADAYNMGQDEEMLLGAPLDAVECGKSGKPAAIAREIGKRPVLAFGNSTGDYSMLNYAQGNPDHAGMGFFIVCDDTEREYGSAEKAAAFYENAAAEGWTAISMANDWKTIYGDGVKKTGLPGAEEELSDAA